MGMVEKLVMLSKPIILTTHNKIMYIKWENKVNTEIQAQIGRDYW